MLKVLHAFNRWPTWMWANWEIVALADWPQKHNTGLPANKKAGFYGLGVYSLWESMESIMQYLKKTDPAALKVAEEAFRCFEPYRKDEGASYARASEFVTELCKNEVVRLLREIQHKLRQYNNSIEKVLENEGDVEFVDEDVLKDYHHIAMVQPQKSLYENNHCTHRFFSNIGERC